MDGSSVPVAGPPRSEAHSEPVPGTTGVDAFELLRDSELLWSEDLAEALQDGSADARHRRRLVREALRAYDRLRVEQAPRADPLLVFRHWPVCTVVSLAGLAATHPDRQAFHTALTRFLTEGIDPDEPSARRVGTHVDNWLRAWADCWRKIAASTRLGTPDAPAETPGLPLLLTLTGIVGPDTGAPELRLDPETGALVLVPADGACHGWTVRAGDALCAVAAGRWVVHRPAPEIECRHLLGRIHRIPLVDPSDPLLVFRPDRTLIPPGRALPAGEVWLLHPGEPPQEAFDGAWRVLEEAVPPPGWSGWWLGRVALDDTTRVRAFAPGRPPGRGATSPRRARCGSSCLPRWRGSSISRASRSIPVCPGSSSPWYRGPGRSRCARKGTPPRCCGVSPPAARRSPWPGSRSGPSSAGSRSRSSLPRVARRPRRSPWPRTSCWRPGRRCASWSATAG